MNAVVAVVECVFENAFPLPLGEGRVRDPRKPQ